MIMQGWLRTPRVSALLAAAAIAAAVILGLLAMHTMSGGTHAGHDTAVPASVGASHADHSDHAAAADCDESSCGAADALAAGCILALLALVMLTAPAPTRWSIGAAAPPASLPVPLRRVATPLTLIELSISRT